MSPSINLNEEYLRNLEGYSFRREALEFFLEALKNPRGRRLRDLIKGEILYSWVYFLKFVGGEKRKKYLQRYVENLTQEEKEGDLLRTYRSFSVIKGEKLFKAQFDLKKFFEEEERLQFPINLSKTKMEMGVAKLPFKIFDEIYLEFQINLINGTKMKLRAEDYGALSSFQFPERQDKNKDMKKGGYPKYVALLEKKLIRGDMRHQDWFLLVRFLANSGYTESKILTFLKKSPLYKREIALPQVRNILERGYGFPSKRELILNGLMEEEG